jgi:hypothetical protein
MVTTIKNVKTVYLLVTCVLVFSNCNSSQTQSNKADTSQPPVVSREPGKNDSDYASEEAIQMISNFYKEYITINSGDLADEKELSKIKKKYCTARLLDFIANEELDYDIIVDAQDYDMEWVKTLSVTKELPEGDTYIVKFSSSGQTEKSIKVKVQKENNTWKIDSILN